MYGMSHAFISSNFDDVLLDCALLYILWVLWREDGGRIWCPAT